MADRLPPNAIEAILATLKEGLLGIAAWKAKREVLRYGLVCQAWLEPSRKVAFAELRVQDFERELWHKDPNAHGGGPASIEQLAVVCTTRPQRLRHLRKLRVHTITNEHENTSAFDSLFTVVGMHATGLRALDVHDFGVMSNFAGAALAQRSLESLTISWSWTYGGAREAWAPSMPAADGGLLARLLDGPTRLSLRYLDMSECCKDGIPTVLAALRGRELPSLIKWTSTSTDHEPFSIKNWEHFASTDYPMYAPQLKSLRMDAPLLEWLSPRATFISQISTLKTGTQPDLSLFAGLHELDWFGRSACAKVFLDRLSPQLKHLKIFDDDCEPALKSWFADFQRAGRQLEVLEIRHNRTAQPWRWLKTSCAKNGIELVWHYNRRAYRSRCHDADARQRRLVIQWRSQTSSAM